MTRGMLICRQVPVRLRLAEGQLPHESAYSGSAAGCVGAVTTIILSSCLTKGQRPRELDLSLTAVCSQTPGLELHLAAVGPVLLQFAVEKEPAHQTRADEALAGRMQADRPARDVRVQTRCEGCRCGPTLPDISEQ
jgi:hypothetical protein